MEGTKSEQDPASPSEGKRTVAYSTLLLEALMASSFILPLLFALNPRERTLQAFGQHEPTLLRWPAVASKVPEGRVPTLLTTPRGGLLPGVVGDGSLAQGSQSLRARRPPNQREHEKPSLNLAVRCAGWIEFFVAREKALAPAVLASGSASTFAEGDLLLPEELTLDGPAQVVSKPSHQPNLFRVPRWETPRAERFQSLGRIGADDRPHIRYRPRCWPMYPADKPKRAQQVLPAPTEPLNARQGKLYDEPPEFYRPDRALGAPLAAPTGRSCCLRQRAPKRRLGSALATAALAGGERSLSRPPIPNRSRLSRRVLSSRVNAKGVTRAL